MASGMSAAPIFASVHHNHRVRKSARHTNDEVKRRFGGAAGTARKQVLDGGACLETRRGAVLPPDDRAPLRVHISLLEDVVEDILKVVQVRPIATVNELCSHLLRRARCLVVSDPELRSAVSWSNWTAVNWSNRITVNRSDWYAVS
jgi:hypothetical protein